MGALLEEATADSKWTQRDLANSDVFDYDLNDQVIAVKLNVPNPESTPAGNPTIIYDWNALPQQRLGRHKQSNQYSSRNGKGLSTYPRPSANRTPCKREHRKNS